MNQTIVFGDIHGCYDEWRELIDTIQPDSSDQLFSVGDMIGKGPHSRKVLDLAHRLSNFRSVMGNFEQYLVRKWRENALASIDDPRVLVALRDLESDIDRYLEWIATWPLYLDLEKCLILHAGLTPGIPLHKQDPDDLVNIRTFGAPAKPWYDFYQDDKLIVHGHWAKQGLVIRNNVIGLDTGCVYGKKLTALILPERKFVSVPAKKVYVPIHPAQE
ncbi:MAG: hypothetical protein JW893_02965 [Candidatus Omnitrophica bacterium]|nr:hypothetical protein [Candidatus Omnitrophota bacterium]